MKSQLHPAQPLTRSRGPEVNSSVAECATGQSIPAKSSPSAHFHSNPSAPPKLDAAGATTATAALALLVYGLTRAEEAGLTSLSTLGAVGLSAVLVAVFVLVEARVEHPL